MIAASPLVGLSAFTQHTAHYFTGRSRFALTLAGSCLVAAASYYLIELRFLRLKER